MMDDNLLCQQIQHTNCTAFKPQFIFVSYLLRQIELAV